LGGGVFVCPRHPAASLGNLARRGGSPAGGAASSLSPSRLQSRGPPRRIHRRDGGCQSIATRTRTREARGI